MPLNSMSPSRTSVDRPDTFTLPPPVTFCFSSTNDAANAGLRGSQQRSRGAQVEAKRSRKRRKVAD